jgi:MHS family shikimate/dehydroshikimate transporter-like MFS transporter
MAANESTRQAEGGRGGVPRATMTTGQRRRIAAASVVGSVLEWYDFFLFGSSAALVFNKVFFTGESEFVATLASFATFAVGFAARPVGGLILAHFGDKIGRRPILMTTLVLMGLGTLLIGLLPTYDQIGFWAPVLLVCLRIVQGLGVGAELGGAYVWTTEAATPTTRGFYAALPGGGEFVGVVLAAGAMSLAASLPEEQFLSYGWRLPYIASVVVAIAGLVLRYFTQESAMFQDAVAEGRKQSRPLQEVLRSHKRTVLLMIGAGAATAIASYSIQGYLPAYTSQQLKLPANTAVIAITVASAISVVGVPFGGWLSDRVGRRPLMIGGGIAIAVFAVPFWLMVGTRSLPMIVLAVTIGFAIILNSMVFGPAGSFYSEQLPTEVRFSGLVLARETTAVVFSGTAPFIATLLVHMAGGKPWILAGYMAASGLVTAACTYALAETAPRALRRAAIRAGVNDDSVPIEVEYAEVR